MVNIQKNFGTPQRQLKWRSRHLLQCDKIQDRPIPRNCLFLLPPTLLDPTQNTAAQAGQTLRKIFSSRDITLSVFYSWTINGLADDLLLNMPPVNGDLLPILHLQFQIFHLLHQLLAMFHSLLSRLSRGQGIPGALNGHYVVRVINGYDRQRLVTTSGTDARTG